MKQKTICLSDLHYGQWLFRFKQPVPFHVEYAGPTERLFWRCGIEVDGRPLLSGEDSNYDTLIDHIGGEFWKRYTDFLESPSLQFLYARQWVAFQHMVAEVVDLEELLSQPDATQDR